VPAGPYNDPAFTSAPLSSAADRILSYIPTTAATMFAGDGSVLTLPTASPAAQGITPTPKLTDSGTVLLGIDPATGKVGDTIHLGGLGLRAADGVLVNGVPALVNVINDARIDVVVPSVTAGLGTIEVRIAGVAVPSPRSFTVILDPLAPKVLGFSPATGDAGSTVTITGSAFGGTTAVLFGGTPATTFAVNGLGTQITATVPLSLPAGARTITVVNGHGAADSAGAFTVTVPPPPAATLSVAGLNPTHGLIGATVTISGTGFTGATAATFNGTQTPVIVVNDSTIQAVVPLGATTGAVAVVTPTATSVGGPVFTVDPPVQPHALFGSNPVLADQGSVVQLNGTPSTGAVTFSWTQIGTPRVTLTGANTATPTFTFPSQFVDLTFQLTVSNGTLSESKSLVVKANPGIVTIDAGTQFRTSKSEWRASGTASFPGTNTVTVRTGNVVGTGTIIGTAAVDVTGVWTLSVRGSAVPAATVINVVASRGGSSLAAVTIRT
jgi:hypothetical protein